MEIGRKHRTVELKAMLLPKKFKCLGYLNLLLSRFIREVDLHDDTPSLIVSIANDSRHLILCREIFAAETAIGSAVDRVFQRACLDQGIDPVRLRAKLAPAAKVLGIAVYHPPAIDHYQVLDVKQQSSLQEIKSAFRRKAVHLHPDKQREISANPQAFVELTDAYHTLCDPTLRHLYDVSRDPSSRRWEHQRLHRQTRRSIFVWRYLGVVLLIFLIMLFLYDLFGLREASFDPPKTVCSSEYLSLTSLTEYSISRSHA